MDNLQVHDFPNWPIFDEELNVISSVVSSGHWAGSRGTYLKSFTDDFLAYQGGQYGKPLANGTVTLEASLIALGIQAGDEVIVPACTFYSSISAILRVNAKPVIVDINLSTFCLSMEQVKENITDKTKAIIAVHLAGSMCDMDELLLLAHKHDISVIEDCAHAHGSMWRDKGAGSLGQFGSFSFQHSKLMSSGEGGFLVANKKRHMSDAWSYSNCGRDDSGEYYKHVNIGTNNRMTEMQAAILSCQLVRYDQQLRKREENGKLLAELISTLDSVFCQKFDPRMSRKAYYVFIIYFGEKYHGSDIVGRITKVLDDNAVPMSTPYPSLSDLDVLRQEKYRHKVILNTDSVNNSRTLFNNSLWLHHRVLLAEPIVIKKVFNLIKREVESHKC